MRKPILGTRHPREDRGGAAVVEFAILAPVLFLLIFGLIEYGRMVMVQQLLTNAAREGARVGILDDSTNTDVENAVIDRVAGAFPITASDVETDPNPVNQAGANETVTVTVGVDFDQVSWLPAPLWLGGKRMQASSSMRRETVE